MCNNQRATIQSFQMRLWKKNVREMRQLQQKIDDHYENCAEHAATSFRFRDLIQSDQVIHNREFSKDLIPVNWKPVPYILDTKNGFQKVR